jgi:hypothetical protein
MSCVSRRQGMALVPASEDRWSKEMTETTDSVRGRGASSSGRACVAHGGGLDQSSGAAVSVAPLVSERITGLEIFESSE